MKRFAVVLLLLGTILAADAARARPGVSARFPVITSANVSQLVPIRLLTRGVPDSFVWSSDNKWLIVLVKNTRVAWAYDASNFRLPPRRLEARDDYPVEFWTGPDGKLLRELGWYSYQPTSVILDGKKVGAKSGVVFSPRDGYLAYAQDGANATVLVNLKTRQTRGSSPLNGGWRTGGRNAIPEEFGDRPEVVG
jgi:hypothetical protein